MHTFSSECSLFQSPCVTSWAHGGRGGLHSAQPPCWVSKALSKQLAPLQITVLSTPPPHCLCPPRLCFNRGLCQLRKAVCMSVLCLRVGAEMSSLSLVLRGPQWDLFESEGAICCPSQKHWHHASPQTLCVFCLEVFALPVKSTDSF